MISDLLVSSSILVSAMIAGSIFGFLLQRGGVSEFNVIVRQFLFTDFTVIKIMLTAIVVGGLGLYGLHAAGIQPTLSVVVLPNVGVVVGGLIFGVGMATLGLCPGTCAAAVGQGSPDARFGLLGMLVGALLYIPYAVKINSTLNDWSISKEATLSALFNVSPFLIFGLLFIGLVLLHKIIKN